jgi:hypothetical protein
MERRNGGQVHQELHRGDFFSLLQEMNFLLFDPMDLNWHAMQSVVEKRNAWDVSASSNAGTFPARPDSRF